MKTRSLEKQKPGQLWGSRKWKLMNEWFLWDTKLKEFQWISGWSFPRNGAFDWPPLASCLPLRHLKGEPANWPPFGTASNCAGAHPWALLTVEGWKVLRQATPTDVHRRHLRNKGVGREKKICSWGFLRASWFTLLLPSSSLYSQCLLPLCFSLFANTDYGES